jgi:hypothetical protein
VRRVYDQTVLRVACIVAFALAFEASISTVARASYPPPVRACGSIYYRSNRVAVDLAEVGGGGTLTCSAARGAMALYLRRAAVRSWPAGSGRNLSLTYAMRKFECYTSRRDGLGWDYHCFTNSRNYAKFVDVGGGRRGHLCHRPGPFLCGPG